MFVALLAAALGTGEAEPSIGPEFTKMLAVARLDADCYRGCPAAPTDPDKALEAAMASASWRIEKPNDYVRAFRRALGQYLVDKRFRSRMDPAFTERDYLTFQTALNVLPSYFACIEKEMRAAPDTDFADGAAIDQLLDVADAACLEKKTAVLQRIGFTGPDFHDLDYVADGGKAGGAVATMLQHVQHFVVAYNAGLRGTSWRKAIEVTVLPLSKPKSKCSQWLESNIPGPNAVMLIAGESEHAC